MAHYAELDFNNVVLRVLVVSNDKITDENGQEQEALGIALLRGLFGADTRWVQTSYNSNFRGRYAGIGYSYDAARDAFIPPQPYASWLLDEDTCLWEAPVIMPEDGERYTWNEAAGEWIIVSNLT